MELGGNQGIVRPRVDRDRQLVDALRRGEATAVDHLVATYGDRAHRLATRITLNEADAEEVVQDVLWAASRKIDTFRATSAFGSWVYRITANAAYQKLRKTGSQRHEVSWEDRRRAEAGARSRDRRAAGALPHGLSPTAGSFSLLDQSIATSPARCGRALEPPRSLRPYR